MRKIILLLLFFLFILGCHSKGNYNKTSRYFSMEIEIEITNSNTNHIDAIMEIIEYYDYLLYKKKSDVKINIAYLNNHLELDITLDNELSDIISYAYEFYEYTEGYYTPFICKDYSLNLFNNIINLTSELKLADFIYGYTIEKIISYLNQHSITEYLIKFGKNYLCGEQKRSIEIKENGKLMRFFLQNEILWYPIGNTYINPFNEKEIINSTYYFRVKKPFDIAYLAVMAQAYIIAKDDKNEDFIAEKLQKFKIEILGI